MADFPPFGLVNAIDSALGTHPSLKARSDVQGILTAMDSCGIYGLDLLDAVLIYIYMPDATVFV